VRGLSPFAYWVDEVASMSPPTPAEETASLASLTGSEPAGGLEPALMRLKLISDAREKNIPWSSIGAALGMSGKEAKASAKRLARYANRRLLEAQARELAADHGGPYGHVLGGIALTARSHVPGSPPIAPEGVLSLPGGDPAPYR
jgi:hypothetical protein